MRQSKARNRIKSHGVFLLKVEVTLTGDCFRFFLFLRIWISFWGIASMSRTRFNAHKPLSKEAGCTHLPNFPFKWDNKTCFGRALVCCFSFFWGDMFHKKYLFFQDIDRVSLRSFWEIQTSCIPQKYMIMAHFLSCTHEVTFHSNKDFKHER